MKESINPIANRVADGRKLLARKMVLTTVSSIPALVYKKVVLKTNDDTERLSNAWGGLGVMTEDDEHAVDYKEKGFAMVLLDSFIGGALNKSLIGVDYAEPSFMANIEPFDAEKDIFKQHKNETGWYPESGDILCLFISAEYVVWVENVGQTGQSIMADFGVKYLLNKRDDLSYLDVFKNRPSFPENTP